MPRRDFSRVRLGDCSIVSFTSGPISLVVGQRVAAGMPEHVGVDLEADLSFVTGAGEQLGETRWGERPQRSEAKTICRRRPLPSTTGRTSWSG